MYDRSKSKITCKMTIAIVCDHTSCQNGNVGTITTTHLEDQVRRFPMLQHGYSLHMTNKTRQWCLEFYICPSIWRASCLIVIIVRYLLLRSPTVRTILTLIAQMLLHRPANRASGRELLANSTLLVERPTDSLSCASECTARCEVGQLSVMQRVQGKKVMLEGSRRTRECLSDGAVGGER